MPTLGRLKGGLTISCKRCGHKVVWSRDRATANLGAGATPQEVRAKLRCSRCGARGVDYQIVING